jgi:hypothetical protein
MDDPCTNKPRWLLESPSCLIQCFLSETTKEVKHRSMDVRYCHRMDRNFLLTPAYDVVLYDDYDRYLPGE